MAYQRWSDSHWYVWYSGIDRTNHVGRDHKAIETVTVSMPNIDRWIPDIVLTYQEVKSDTTKAVNRVCAYELEQFGYEHSEHERTQLAKAFKQFINDIDRDYARQSYKHV